MKISDHGDVLEFNDNLVFFGNKLFQRPLFNELFPDYKFFELHQVHGAHVIPRSSNVTKADGHFTDQPNEALLIRTADCLPVFISTDQQIFAFHCGWRSIAQNILSTPYLKAKDVTSLSIGPHIHQDNFEVEIDCLEPLKKIASQLHLEEDWYIQKDIKYFPDLSKLVSGHFKTTTQVSSVNTYTSENHYSYRENKTEGRNWSFIVRRK